jgi:membrane peptidoglycan carboxypeptidase
MNEILGENARYGTGEGSGDGVHPNAGKTGTTSDHADAWFVGYTRDL